MLYLFGIAEDLRCLSVSSLITCRFNAKAQSSKDAKGGSANDLHRWLTLTLKSEFFFASLRLGVFALKSSFCADKTLGWRYFAEL
jgi:hypothetical protein